MTRLAPSLRRALLLSALAAPVAAQPLSTDPPPFPEPSMPPLRRNDGDEGGFTLGLSLGWAMPFGAAADDGGTGKSDLSRALRGAIPVGVSLGYRALPHLHVGAFVEMAPGVVSHGADGPCALPTTSCSAWDLRAGVVFEVHALPRSRIDPWVGAGLGYEAFHFSVSPGPGTLDLQGMEFAHLDAGVDVRLWRALRLGPFATFTVGRYDTGNLGVDGSSVSGPIGNKAIHEWLRFGLRLRYDVK